MPARSRPGLPRRSGDYVLTLDADMSHEPDFVGEDVARAHAGRHRNRVALYARRHRLHLASCATGSAGCSTSACAAMLSMPVRRHVERLSPVSARSADGLKIERAQFRGLRKRSWSRHTRKASACTKFHSPISRAKAGSSHARLLRFGIDLATRCTASSGACATRSHSADYDERAFYSIIPIQRYWQRRRHRITTFWARGSDRILESVAARA